MAPFRCAPLRPSHCLLRPYGTCIQRAPPSYVPRAATPPVGSLIPGQSWQRHSIWELAYLWEGYKNGKFTCPVHGHRAESKWTRWEWTQKKRDSNYIAVGLVLSSGAILLVVPVLERPWLSVYAKWQGASLHRLSFGAPKGIEPSPRRLRRQAKKKNKSRLGRDF